MKKLVMLKNEEFNSELKRIMVRYFPEIQVQERFLQSEQYLSLLNFMITQKILNPQEVPKLSENLLTFYCESLPKF